MKGLLRGEVSLGVARSRNIGAVVQLLEQFPAALRVDRTTEFVAHPLSDFGAGPQSTVWGRVLQGGIKLSEVLRRKERSSARIGVTAIADAIRTIGVVALGNRTDPGSRVGSGLDDLLGGKALGKQPDNLPLAACDRIGALTVALFEFCELQMRSESLLFHTLSIHPDLVLHR